MRSRPAPLGGEHLSGSSASDAHLAKDQVLKTSTNTWLPSRLRVYVFDRLVRPERFELPTPWLVGVSATIVP